MKNTKIAIASGKGGTGKTTVATNLAVTLQETLKKPIQLIDCDIEEPNDSIFFDVAPTSSKEVRIIVPTILEDKCSFCGICSDTCEYSAIAILKEAKKKFISEDLCHGCNACFHFCPENAMAKKNKILGSVNFYDIDNLKIIEGKLNISETMPTPVLRETLKEMDTNKLTILDAPPGTSCSMVTTISEADYVILVTEPTPFGLHDLKLAAEVLFDMKKPTGVIINRAGLGDNKIYEYLKEVHLPILLEIPFDKKIAEIYSKGNLIIESMPEYKKQFLNVYNQIKLTLEGES